MPGSPAVKILLISGSARSGSTNSAVLRSAASVAPDGVEAELLEGIGDLPLFNPDDDLEGEPVDPRVAAMRQSVAGADALLICTPEYAGRAAGRAQEPAGVDDRRRRHLRQAGGLDQRRRTGRPDRRRRRSWFASQGAPVLRVRTSPRTRRPGSRCHARTSMAVARSPSRRHAERLPRSLERLAGSTFTGAAKPDPGCGGSPRNPPSPPRGTHPSAWRLTVLRRYRH